MLCWYLFLPFILIKILLNIKLFGVNNKSNSNISQRLRYGPSLGRIGIFQCDSFPALNHWLIFSIACVISANLSRVIVSNGNFTLASLFKRLEKLLISLLNVSW